MGWSTTTTVSLSVESEGFRLHVGLTQVSPSAIEWAALAVVAPVESNTVDAVLEEHSHRNLGTFRGLFHGMQAVEKYARKWQRDRKTDPRCTCDEISTTPATDHQRDRSVRTEQDGAGDDDAGEEREQPER